VTDRWQVSNQITALSPAARAFLREQLGALNACRGSSCRTVSAGIPRTAGEIRALA
jgi:hypothetical protein